MSHNEYLAFNFQNFDRDSFRLTGEKKVIRPVKGIPGEGCGRGIQVGGTHAPEGDSCRCMAKTTTVL